MNEHGAIRPGTNLPRYARQRMNPHLEPVQLLSECPFVQASKSPSVRAGTAGVAGPAAG